MVDAVYRGNIEELLSVISHLKKYVIAFVIVLLVLLSVFHFSKYSVHFVPLVIITLVLLPAVYFITVFVVKFSSSVISSNQTREVTAMNDNSDQGHGLKTPERPYPNSPTPPPTYEEATRNDHYYQPQPWLPSTSGGYTSRSSAVFDVQQQYNSDVGAMAIHGRRPDTAAAAAAAVAMTTATTTTMTPNNSAFRVVADGGVGVRPAAPKPIQNIPSVTITLDDDQRPMEI